MTDFTILLGGRLAASDRLRAIVAATRVLAADSGMRHAVGLGVVPELWIGDFDSDPGPLPDHLAAVPRDVFSPEKDKTDGELAVEAALAAGATRLILAGAFGGARTDHEMLHLAMAIRLAEGGADVLLTSGDQDGLPMPHGEISPDWPDGTLFSVVALTDLRGLTVRGAKWPLDAVDMPFGSSLTLSNETRGRLVVRLEGGRGLLIAQRPA